MIFVAVGEHDAVDCVHAVAYVIEVRQDKIYAWLGFFWEEYAAIDDEDASVEFKDGHVSADFADSA